VKLLGAALGAVAAGIVGYLALRRRERSEFEQTCGVIEGSLVHGRPDLWTPEFREAMGELIRAAKRQMEAEGRG
jgi:hypothetical protein